MALGPSLISGTYEVTSIILKILTLLCRTCLGVNGILGGGVSGVTTSDLVGVYFLSNRLGESSTVTVTFRSRVKATVACWASLLVTTFLLESRC